MKAAFRILIAAAMLAPPAHVAAAAPAAQAEARRWTAAEANGWHAKQPWLTGANFIPADAINELEMWQAATFDPAEIDRELGWAQREYGMNTMRVFLHDLAWQQDPEGFKRRIDQFLAIAVRHGIRPVFVLFDSCWDPNPKVGPQHPPIPGVHNSGWLRSPGRAALLDPAQEPRLRAYVEGVVGAFGGDPRILAWDVWNEPDNLGGGAYGLPELGPEEARVAALLPRVFAWARSRHPIQPLTSGVWKGDDWAPAAKLGAIPRIQLDQSDIVSFHDYGWPEQFERRVAQLKGWGRPLLCTEWMARGAGSTVDAVLPVGRREHVGMINWGFVQGKIQTWLPWDSWKRPYVTDEPTIWFHDLVKPDGTPYREREAEIFRSLRTSADPVR
jgi:hypothetical protein